MNVLARILKRACRCHWHGEPGAWSCCWCETTSDAQEKPVPRTAECWQAERFEGNLPPNGPLAGTTFSPRRRKRAGVAA